MNSERQMPEIFKILLEDIQYNDILKRFARETDISYPVKYQSLFIKSRMLYDNKRGPYKDILNRNRFNDPTRWYSTINGEVQEKFTTVYYHYANIRKLETMAMKYCVEIIERMKQLSLKRPITVGFNYRKFSIEYEAFIFQLRALFDHFINSVSYYFGFRTIKRKSFLNKLSELTLKNKKAELILKIFENELPNIELLESKSKTSFGDMSDRDKIAHVGTISLNPLNIIFNPLKGPIILPFGRYEIKTPIEDHPSLSESIGPLMFGLFDFITNVYFALFASGRED